MWSIIKCWDIFGTNATALSFRDSDLIGFGGWYFHSLQDDFKVPWKIEEPLLKYYHQQPQYFLIYLKFTACQHSFIPMISFHPYTSTYLLK